MGIVLSPDKDADRRLLLLEFVTSERWVFNSRFYPFIKGVAEALGMKTRWLCFGAEFCMEKVGATDVRRHMPLTSEELALVNDEIAALQPTHVMVSHVPCPELVERLRGISGGIPILSLEDSTAEEGMVTVFEWCGGLRDGSVAPGGKEATAAGESPNQDPALFAGTSRADWLLRWLGEDPADHPDFDGYMVDTVVPTYDARMCNDAAREKRPHILLMGGLACDHRHKVQRNPHYEGLDLTECTHDFGCSYCTWYRGPNGDLSLDPLRAARIQLERILETAGEEGRFCGVLDVFDVRLFSKLTALFDMVLQLNLPPTMFCFEPRLDRFLTVREQLESVLPRIEERGHSISLFRLGAENLVEEENEFYNKHITLKQIDEAARQLKEMTERFPKSFLPDPTWGYITCSPWTTLEMFETGVRRAMERNFEPKGVWLYTPLLLYRGSPITVLALKQGDIVLDQHEELAMLYEASVNQVAFNVFLAWRFKDERMGHAFALVVRFCAAALRDKYPDTIFEGDSLYRQLLDDPEVERGFQRPDLFALAVIAAIRSAEPPYSRRSLLVEALKSYVLADKPSSGNPSSASAGQTPAWLDKLKWLAGAVLERYASRFPDLVVNELLPDGQEGGFRLHIEWAGTPLHLIFRRLGSGSPSWFRSSHFEVSHAKETPLGPRLNSVGIQRFIEIFDASVTRYVPELVAPLPRK